MNICKACKNAYISHSLSGYHITCKYDRKDYSFASNVACSRFMDNKSDLYLYKEEFAPPEFLTEEEFRV